jgi:hypothetical protein
MKNKEAEVSATAISMAAFIAFNNKKKERRRKIMRIVTIVNQQINRYHESTSSVTTHCIDRFGSY